MREAYGISSHINRPTSLTKVYTCVVPRQVIDLCSRAPFLDVNLYICAVLDAKPWTYVVFVALASIGFQRSSQIVVFGSEGQESSKIKNILSTEIGLNTVSEIAKIGLFRRKLQFMLYCDMIGPNDFFSLNILSSHF